MCGLKKKILTLSRMDFHFFDVFFGKAVWCFQSFSAVQIVSQNIGLYSSKGVGKQFIVTDRLILYSLFTFYRCGSKTQVTCPRSIWLEYSDHMSCFLGIVPVYACCPVSLSKLVLFGGQIIWSLFLRIESQAFLTLKS